MKPKATPQQQRGTLPSETKAKWKVANVGDMLSAPPSEPLGKI